MRIEAGNLISVASIVAGFGITVIMFRVQRELSIQESRPTLRSTLAWSDYLIIASVFLALLGSVEVLLLDPAVPHYLQAVAAAACAAAVFLQVGYIPGILFHYGIRYGRNSTIDDRQSGEPGERAIVILSAVVALLVAAWVFRQHLQAQ